ncbi:MULTISPECIES: DUF2627 domain-containing protein [Pontibacillus]|uniref:DUF2627 domain-containing protein n=1 Tax=Pontibacillus chungwhensis TaxID=265426 RepID=A0ABY8UTP1_9BACI|nr:MULTISPECIES: DUF2627 domain-containing protein [Pontibacillus]MCD5323499.1 DUF2627 domain-containing protein [Pontibacillus sp. HN14]WIF96874.1 DUF2627 domain-containing protein [Pontibacillus chungwhensis]
MARFTAMLILFIPGALAVLGFKLMRDSLFGIVHPLLLQVWVQFAFGLIAFLGGLAFIGGFILYRDKKLGKTQGRFKK